MEEEQKLILRLKREGDAEAFAGLYDAYSPAAWRVCLLILRDEGEAEDALQETFLHVWRRIGSFDPARGAFKTWVSLLARSKSIDRLRRRRRLAAKVALSADGSLEHLDPRASHNPERDALEARRLERVLGLLKALPPEQAEVLRLSYFGGMNQRELAAFLKLPLGTVKTRQRLAQRRLARILGKDTQAWL